MTTKASPNQTKPILGQLLVFLSLTYFLDRNPQNPPEVIWLNIIPETTPMCGLLFIGPIPGQIQYIEFCFWLHVIPSYLIIYDTQCLMQGKILCPLNNSGEPVKLLSNHHKYDYLNFQEDSLKKRSMQKLWVSCRQSQISQRILMRWSFTWRLLLINLNILMTPGNISSNCS